jgi:hypothetical protein
MKHNFAKNSTLAALPIAFATLGALGPQATTTAEPLPYGPDTCIQGFVWREGNPNDHVCVTPDVRSQTARDNQLAASRRAPNGGPYGPDTCLQGYVWRDAFEGDHVCVTPDTRTEAANDNAAAASRMQANAAQPQPLQGPAVSWDGRLGGLTAHITDRSGVAGQCTYDSDGYVRSFFLPANSTYDLVIVPAIPEFRNWNVKITCDNGTTTQTTNFF